MVCTPEAHIPIADVRVDHGVVYLEFKKSRSNVKETMTMDPLYGLYSIRRWRGILRRI